MKTSLRWNHIPLFWKIYGSIVLALFLVVGSVEYCFEPLVATLLRGVSGGFQEWHEAVLWLIAIIFPAFGGGFIVTRFVSGKLEKTARVAGQIAHGNLQARLPVAGNNKDPFDRLANSFNEMAASIERLLDNERRLLADISHELRAPLTRITIAAELLTKRDEKATKQALVARLEKEISQLNELVEILLKQGKDRFLNANLFERLNFTDIVSTMCEDADFQAQPQSKSVLFSRDKPVFITGNKIFLQRMIGNVLSNALFYTPRHSTIDVFLIYDAKSLRLTIRDYGPGVPEEECKDIFRAFYRVDSSRSRSSGGAGLGLALAKDAAMVHGGDMTAHNASPGLLVQIDLPVSLVTP